MKTRVFALATVVLVALGLGWGKKKEKQPLPDVVLKAQTVFVTIQPGANEPVSDMWANQKAVKDVEEALMKWGRFRLALNAETADIVIAVMKGSGKAASPTVGGGPVDSRPVILDKTDNQIRIGGQQGRPPDATQTNDPNTDGRAHPGMQIGNEDDLLKVYLGNVQHPLDSSPVWSYMGHDALRAPSVPAVEQFRKAVEESEKAAARKQQEKQKQQQQQQQPQPTTKNGT